MLMRCNPRPYPLNESSVWAREVRPGLQLLDVMNFSPNRVADEILGFLTLSCQELEWVCHLQ